MAELLAAGTIPESYRAWSFERTGMYRSAPTKRAYDEAKARLEHPVAAVRDGADEERAAMNGAGHAPADR